MLYEYKKIMKDIFKYNSTLMAHVNFTIGNGLVDSNSNIYYI